MPTKTPQQRMADDGELETAFPVSSGAQHRTKSMVIVFFKYKKLKSGLSAFIFK